MAARRRGETEEHTPIVYIRRLRAEELENLSEDLRLLLPGALENSTLFCVAPNKLKSHGILHRCGRWQDHNFALHHGIDLLILRDGLEVDLETLCKGMLTDEITASDLNREARRTKTQEEMAEDAKEALKLQSVRQRRAAMSKGLALNALAVENRVIVEDQAHVLAKWLGARDSSQHEGCHCTLKSLHLVNTMLQNKGCSIIASSLPNNQQLTSINFGYNTIGDVGFAELCRANLGRKLSVLKFAGNNIGDQGCKMIPPLLETVALVELHLQNNSIGDEGAHSIARGMALNGSLRVLNLNGNRLRDPGVAAITATLMLTGGTENNSIGALVNMSRRLGNIPPEVIKKNAYVPNTSLQSLHLASNWLRDETAQEIAMVFETNCSLTNVELAGNRIGDPGAKALARVLKSPLVDEQGNRVGRNLVLSCNTIGQSGIVDLGKALKACNHLHTLQVEGMRVAFGWRASIQQHAAKPPPETPDTPKLPRIRLESIHREKKVIDIEAMVNAEFSIKKSTKGLRLSKNMKDAFLPVDRFIEDHLSTLKYQSGWGQATTRESTARLSTARLTSQGSGSGSLSARLPTSSTQASRTTGKYTGHLMNDAVDGGTLVIDDDPEFRALCNRLNVPVEDKMRNRLKALNERQREQRAKIYDRFLDIQSKFHRPVVTSAVHVQSLFRMKSSTRLAASIRQKNQEEFESAANEAKTDLAEDRKKAVDSILRSFAAPGLRRMFSNWTHHVEECSVKRDDIVKLFTVYCSRMGVSACGTSLLKKYVAARDESMLSFKGIGISSLAARALSFLFMGVENCRLCRGIGTVSGDTFKGVTKDPMAEIMTPASVFEAVDLDGSGFVDASELLVALRYLGLNLNLEEVQAVMAIIDVDNSGQVDKTEFQLLFKNINSSGSHGHCVLCKGKGHTNKQCQLEEPWPRQVPPLLDIRDWLGFEGIRELDLSNNCLRSSGASDVVNIARMCAKTLMVLRIAHTELADEGAQAISALFNDKMMHLIECDLAGNYIGDSGMHHISQAVQESKTLTMLNIASNKCTGSGCCVLGDMLYECESLTELDISWNGIGGEQASTFWRGVGNSRSLLRLHAHWNGFCDLRACEAMSEAFQANGTLQYLDLSHNRITRQCCELISKGFSLNETLIELRLDGNPLGLQGAKVLLAAAEEGAKGSDYNRVVRMENCSVGVLDMSMFDPSYPTGRYMLDMTNESARQVLRNVLRLIAQGKVVFERMLLVLDLEKRDSSGELSKDPETGEQLYEHSKEPFALKCFMTTEQFEQKGLIDSDPMEWEMPDAGMLEFNLLAISSKNKMIEKGQGCKVDQFDSYFLRCMTNVRTAAAKVAELASLLPNNVKMPFSHFKILFNILREFPDNGCLLLVQEYWHRVDGDPCYRDVMALLTEDERNEFMEKVNTPTIVYTKNNPSGHYHLNLDVAEDQQTATALVAAKLEQAAVEKTLAEYQKRRAGGPRDAAVLDKYKTRIVPSLLATLVLAANS